MTGQWTQCKVWHVHQVVHFTAGCVPSAAPLIWQVGGPGLDYPPAVAVLLPTTVAGPGEVIAMAYTTHTSLSCKWLALALISTFMIYTGPLYLTCNIIHYIQTTESPVVTSHIVWEEERQLLWSVICNWVVTWAEINTIRWANNSMRVSLLCVTVRWGKTATYTDPSVCNMQHACHCTESARGCTGCW